MDKISKGISLEQLHELDSDEKSGMLFFLTGYLSKSPEFQEALTAAYGEQMSARARRVGTGMVSYPH